MNELSQTIDSIVAIDDEATIEQCAQAKVRLQGMQQLISQAMRLLDRKIISCMKAHGVEHFDVGHIRYYIGRYKTTRCRNVQKTIEAILSVASLEELADCLAAQPFKPARTTRLLGDRATELFDTTMKETLKEADSDESEKLLSINTRFLEESHEAQ